jgi:hypothetical protein|nr:MAG TPA: hypothetical protein [Caudoviricetes sp.]
MDKAVLIMDMPYCVGFNDCLDDILGETHGKEKL